MLQSTPNSDTQFAPIALFVYNRPDHTQKTVEALCANIGANESELYIFSDGSKNQDSAEAIEKVRSYCRGITGFKEVHFISRDNNLGLAQSIINGVTEVLNIYGKIIVMEDDLVTSPFFLIYMNEALNLYEKEERVASIHGYIYPVKEPLPKTFFLRGADCWGWATWKRAWDLFEPDGQILLDKLEKTGLMKEFDLDGAHSFSGMLKRQISGQNNSWAIRWHASAFLADKLTLYPGTSLVNNIGHDSSGVHSGSSDIYTTAVSQRKISIGSIAINENKDTRRAVANYFRSLRPGIWKRVLLKLGL